MKYVEFELQLQDLLDERRLHDVDRLLAQVEPEDRERCERLAAAYGTLFDGLESWNAPTCDATLTQQVLDQLQADPSPAVGGSVSSGPAGAWLPIAALALAASLLILAFIPFSLSGEKDDRLGTYVASTDADPDWDNEPLDWEDAQYVATVQSPFDMTWELTNDLVATTTTPPQLPLDSSSLAMTSLDAGPWLDSVQTRFRPLTQTMGSALMVIKDVTLPAPPSAADPEAKPQARGARLRTVTGQRVT